MAKFEQMLADYRRTRKSTLVEPFCHAPFVNLHFSQGGKALACCHNRTYILGTYPVQSVGEIWSGEKLKNLRRSMVSNDLSNGCQSCMRQLISGDFIGLADMAGSYDQEWLSEYWKGSPETVADPDQFHRSPFMLEFELDNSCNLQCVMCHGVASSSIRKYRDHLPPLPSPYDTAFVDQLEEILPEVLIAGFTGGEPFLIPVYYEIWDRIAKCNPQMLLPIVTNGTIMNDRVRGLLESLNFIINVSMDSIVKETYESIRVGSDFDTVMENSLYFADLMHKRGRPFFWRCCVLRQNWREIPEMVRFCDDKGIQVIFNQVEFPLDFSLHTLPRSELLEIADFLKRADTFNSSNPVQEFNHAQYRGLAQRIATLVEPETWRNSLSDRLETARNNPMLNEVSVRGARISSHSMADALAEKVATYVATRLTIDQAMQVSNERVVWQVELDSLAQQRREIENFRAQVPLQDFARVFLNVCLRTNIKITGVRAEHSVEVFRQIDQLVELIRQHTNPYTIIDSMIEYPPDELYKSFCQGDIDSLMQQVVSRLDLIEVRRDHANTLAIPVFPASPKTFCSYAWEFVCVSLDSATTQVCCKAPIYDVTAHDIKMYGSDVIDNTDQFRKRREDLLAGIENEDCESCWSLERVGSISFRHKAAVTDLSKYLESSRASGNGSDLQSILAALPSKTNPKFVQIKLGNPCDLKCVYCCSYYSSSWAAEDERAGIASLRERSAADEVKEQFSEAFWQWFAALEGSIDEVEFIGGEPTFNPSLYEALSKIQEVCAGWDDALIPRIAIVTNLNTPRTHWEKLSRYIRDSRLRFRFQISNEAWGSRAEYIRFGLRWERFEQNFEDLVNSASRTDRVELNVMLSLNALCISSMSQYLEWVRDHSQKLYDGTGRHIGVFVNEVQDPPYLGIGVLPPHYAEFLDPAIECLSRWPAPEGWAGEAHSNMAAVLEEARNRIRNQIVSPLIARQFIERMRDLDQRRKIDCRTTFPEYKDLLVGYETDTIPVADITPVQTQITLERANEVVAAFGRVLETFTESRGMALDTSVLAHSKREIQESLIRFWQLATADSSDKVAMREALLRLAYFQENVGSHPVAVDDKGPESTRLLNLITQERNALPTSLG